MKIRDRLTLLFTVIMGAILLAFAVAIYFTYSANREDEFYRQLRQQAITKANLLFTAEVAPETLQTIYRNTRNLHYQEEVAVYDTAFQLLYHDAVDLDFVKETADMIAEIRQKGEIQFTQDDVQVVGFVFPFAGQDYVITAAAYDAYGFTKLRNLQVSLTLALLFGMALVFLMGRFFSKQALKPVATLADKAAKIGASNIDQRLPTGNGKDELAELAHTFNQMLQRLERSFTAQRQFVSHVAHELRTPLAAMRAELDLARSQKRSPERYEQAIDLALQDADKLSRLTAGMLDLAKASYDQSAIHFAEVRLDEVLLDARQQVLKANPAYRIQMTFEKETDDSQCLSGQGNEYLLRTAFVNLMENACKFSPAHEAFVSIDFNDTHTILQVQDKGIGIPEAELQQVFEPFYRGTNRQFADGNGIGLSLTQRIVKLHGGEITLQSAQGIGTTFTVSLPHR